MGLALLSLVLMFADSRSDYMARVRYYVGFVVTPLHYVAELPGRGLDVVGGLFESRNQLQRENARLQEQLLIQQYQLQKLEHLTAENRRLNELLNASTAVKEDVVRVEMVGESPDPFAKRILIGKGSTDGVYIGQAVFDAYGLMGQVVEVAPLTSWVLLITDPQHATPVQINRNGMRAIASGTRDSLHLLNLDNIPNTADVQVGDELVTSGLGERFPAGYKVGVVSSVTNDPGKPFATVVVNPTAQIDRSRNLLLAFDSRIRPVVDGNLEHGPVSADVSPDTGVIVGNPVEGPNATSAAGEPANPQTVPTTEISEAAGTTLPTTPLQDATPQTEVGNSDATAEANNVDEEADNTLVPEPLTVPADEGAN